MSGMPLLFMIHDLKKNENKLELSGFKQFSGFKIHFHKSQPFLFFDEAQEA